MALSSHGDLRSIQKEKHPSRPGIRELSRTSNPNVGKEDQRGAKSASGRCVASCDRDRSCKLAGRQNTTGWKPPDGAPDNGSIEARWTWRIRCLFLLETGQTAIASLFLCCISHDCTRSLSKGEVDSTPSNMCSSDYILPRNCPIKHWSMVSVCRLFF